MLGMAAALVLGPWVAGAGAQSALSSVWERRDNWPNTSGPDDAVDIGWYVRNRGTPLAEYWVYVTGTMTNAYGGTVIATYRYNMMNPNDVDVAYYPLDAMTTGDPHKAVAMAVDQATGNIYVTGEAPQPDGTVKDYIVLKYASDLTIHDSSSVEHWAPTGIDTEGVRRYDHNGGNDWPADIAVVGTGDDARLFVTGTSSSAGVGGAGLDIATIAYIARTGEKAWTSLPNGVQRYNGPANGDDIAVELGAMEVVEPEASGWNVFVGGTTWGGLAAAWNLVALGNSSIGTPINQNWPVVYNHPNSYIERCTGLAVVNPSFGGQNVPARIALCGTSEPPSDEETNYLAFVVTALGIPFWTDVGDGPGARTFDFGAEGSSDDAAADAAITSGPTQGSAYLWVTGRARNGEAYDIGTLVYDVDDANGTLFAWTAFGDPEASDEQGVAIVPKPGGGAWVAANRYQPNSLKPYTYLTLKYDGPGTGPYQLSVLAQAEYPGEYYENKSRAMTWMPPVQSPQVNDPTEGLFVTGRSASFQWGLDYLTLRYNP